MPLDRGPLLAELQRRRQELQQESPACWESRGLTVGDPQQQAHEEDQLTIAEQFGTHAARALSCLDVVLPVAWHAGPTAARALRVASSDICAVTRDVFTLVLQWCPSCIYVCGGEDDHSIYPTVDRFNPVLGIWEPVAPMLSARSGAAAAGVEGKLYVCGGISNRGEALCTVACYDPLANAWEAVPNMQQCRHRPVAAAVAGVLCIIGGRDTSDHHQSAECLDLSCANHASWAPTESRVAWTSLADLAEPRHGAVAATISGTMYIAGGFDGHLDLKSAERFVMSTGAWQRIPDMSERRHGPLAAAIGSNWYVCGGFDGPTLGAAEFFDTTSDTWHGFETAPVWRRGAVAAAVVGKMYVCGGQSGFVEGHVSSIDMYEPQAERWQPFFAVADAEHESPTSQQRQVRTVVVRVASGELMLHSEEVHSSSARSSNLSVQRRNAAAATVAV